jgi:predicted dehydrogenase
MKRRHFVAAAAGSVAGAAPRTPIGIGFLGSTHSHAEAKLKIVRQSPDWKLVGVSETHPQLRAMLAGDGIALLDRDRLLNHPDVRVIAVESSVRDHARDGMAVLGAGKHLHLEKAPAQTIHDFEDIVTVAARRKLLLQVGYMWRYHPGVEKILEAARQGWLGDVYLVKGVIGNQLAPERRPEWAEFAGGVMFDLGGHVIDPLIRLLGKPLKVTSFLRTDGAFQDKLRDNTAAVFEWPSALGIVQSTTLQPGSSRIRGIEVHGNNGSAILKPIEPPQLSLFLSRPAGPYVSGPQTVELRRYNRYVDDFFELAAAVRGERTLRVSHAEDLALQETLLRASGMA